MSRAVLMFEMPLDGPSTESDARVLLDLGADNLCIVPRPPDFVEKLRLGCLPQVPILSVTPGRLVARSRGK